MLLLLLLRISGLIKADGTLDGEFHVDLYTLPDHLVKSLWDFTAERVAL